MYPVDGAGVAVEEHAHRLFEDGLCLLLGDLLLAALDTLAEEGLGEVGGVAGADRAREVGSTTEVDNAEEAAETVLVTAGCFFLFAYVSPFFTPATTMLFQRGFILFRRWYMSVVRW